MYKLAVLPFDCHLVLRGNAHETQRPHSFMVEPDPGTLIHLEGRDWRVVEIQDRPDDVPAVVCRPAV